MANNHMRLKQRTIPVFGGTSTYATGVGAGVDSNGFADLPLRSGAKRVYYGAGGSDSNNGLTHATRKLTLPNSAWSSFDGLATDGAGDQIMLMEGTDFGAVLPNINFMAGGYDASYPLVFQSYDGNDPTNPNKFGRATGSNRPRLLGNTNNWGQGGTHQSNIAIRGLDIGTADTPDQILGIADVGSNILFENLRLRSTGISVVDTSGTRRQNWIVRHCMIDNTWSASAATAGHGLYADGSDSLYVEDCFLNHIGWKSTANRTDNPLLGGATEFRHPIYQQVPTDATFRRNLVIDGSGDGGSFRGSITHYGNMIIDSPQIASLGGGVDYEIYRPSGVDIFCSYNAGFGSATVPDSSAAGWGFANQNGRSGSYVKRNVIARSAVGSAAFLLSASAAALAASKPSYMNYDDNICYDWSPSGDTRSTVETNGNPLYHPAWNRNYWDDPAEGTNQNISSLVAPNPYTAAQFYVAAGYANKAAYIAAMTAGFETAPWRTGQQMFLVGYGQDISGMPS